MGSSHHNQRWPEEISLSLKKLLMPSNILRKGKKKELRILMLGQTVSKWAMDPRWSRVAAEERDVGTFLPELILFSHPGSWQEPVNLWAFKDREHLNYPGLAAVRHSLTLPLSFNLQHKLSIMLIDMGLQSSPSALPQLWHTTQPHGGCWWHHICHNEY